MKIDRRKSQRHLTNSLIAITPKGVAHVVNLSSKSVFFKLTSRTHFPDHLVVDLYDATGLNLVGVLAKKVWSKLSTKQSDSSSFKLEVAVEFKNLSPSQEYQLRYYLRQKIV